MRNDYGLSGGERNVLPEARRDLPRRIRPSRYNNAAAALEDLGLQELWYAEGHHSRLDDGKRCLGVAA